MSQNRPKSSCFVPEFCCIMVDVSIAWQFSTQFNPEGQGKRFSVLDYGARKSHKPRLWTPIPSVAGEPATASNYCGGKRDKNSGVRRRAGFDDRDLQVLR